MHLLLTPGKDSLLKSVSIPLYINSVAEDGRC